MEFSEIALAKLLQQLPELANFIITFKDVSEELNREDDTVKVGIFILSFGGKPYYLPVIGKNDVVQPMDSLFDPTNQTFVPLTKPFVEKLVNSQSENLGSKKKIPQTVNANPSVYDLVVPPRTGKMAYASSSRFVEFLAATPNHVKQAFATTMQGDRGFAEGLNKYFDLGDIVKALRNLKHVPINVPTPNQEQISIVTSGTGLSDAEIQEVLTKGYALRGAQKEVRVAVPANDFEAFGRLNQITVNDSNQDFEIIMKSGDKFDGFVPKSIPSPFSEAALLSGHPLDNMFILFSNGDYAVTSSAVTSSPGSKDNKVLKNVFDFCGVLTADQIIHGDRVAIFNTDMELIGVFSTSSVDVSAHGTNLRVYDELRHAHRNIFVSTNCAKVNSPNRRDLYLPKNSVVVRLGKDLREKLETNVHSAQAKLELTTLVTLGAAGHVGYDGVEFSYNGKLVGPEHKIAHVLIVQEGIAPPVADNFIKQAKEFRSTKFYMSKKADFSSGEIPSYGEYSKPTDRRDVFGPDFVPNVQNSFETGDAQTIESTIISELLQAPDMVEYVNEYLPDIKNAIDKIGRIILLSRLNMSKLFTGDNASEVFSFIASLRNVYRMLGDNYIKLERLASTINDDTAAKPKA